MKKGTEHFLESTSEIVWISVPYRTQPNEREIQQKHYSLFFTREETRKIKFPHTIYAMAVLYVMY